LLIAPVAASLAMFGALFFMARAAPGGPNVQSLSQAFPPATAATAEACKGDQCGELVEMEVRDVVPLEEADTHAVVLVSKDREVVLPIFVDENAAVAIAFRLAHISAPHPMAQDLLDTMLEEMGGELREVRIDEIQDSIFMGRVIITQGDKRLTLEARPSDSIAMALSRGVKIFASRGVLQEAGLTSEDVEKLREQGPGVGGSGPETGVESAPDGGEISL
jgi:bifunctional DNase/RNase